MSRKPTGAGPLYCDCGRMFAFLPGFIVIGRLRSGEFAKPANGALFCNGCGAKWEVAVKEQRQAA